MMNDLQNTAQEQSVLRWGGLAGIVGSILFIVVFAIVGFGPVGMEPVEPAVEPMRFPEIRTARIVEEGLYLTVLVLWVIHFLALYRALRGTSLAPALFGSALGILGLVMLVAGALPSVATDPIADLYHAPGATAGDQATLVFLWQATMGILEMLLVTGLVILPTGLIALGIAMLGAPAFGKAFGGVSVVLGVLGVAAGVVLMIYPGTSIAVVGVFSLIIFHLVLGWKVYSLSKGPYVGSLQGGDRPGPNE
jgi:magnesium-transporting ATPase (P-type)